MREADPNILVFSYFKNRQHLKPVCFKGLKVYLLSENSNKVLHFVHLLSFLAVPFSSTLAT